MKMSNTKIMGRGIYIFDDGNSQGDTGNFSEPHLPEPLEVGSLVRIGQVPFVGPVTMLWEGLPGSGGVSVSPPHPLCSARWSFTELAGTAEKPQLKEGLLCEQDAAAPSGPEKKPVTQQIHRLFLLRVKLMHFVNSLHNYIMSRVRVSPASAPEPVAEP